jgi:hypothetical protein
LADLDFDGEGADRPLTAPMSELDSYLAEAKRILAEELEPAPASPHLGEVAEELRWFPNPAEAET